MYYWVAHSTDGCFQDVSNKIFKTKKEAYESMRNSALEKRKWNTEFDEDFDEGELIDYEVLFSKDCIRHNSYSGEYIYEIRELEVK